MHARWALTITGSLLAIAPAVSAQPAPTQLREPRETQDETPPGTAGIDVDLAVDLPLSVAAGLLGGGLAVLKEELVRDRCAPSCDESSLNALDRPFAGRFDERAATAGDVLVGVNLALPHLFGLLDLALDTHPEGAVGFGEDTLILAETLALTAMTHQIIAFAAQRPRPFVYGDRVDEERRNGANGYLSFYSGHTANSFAMATAYCTLFGLRHPRSPWRAPLWPLLHGLAALDGVLRTLSGYHFPTDVLVGGAIGSAIGLAVPWIHVTAAGTEPDPTSGESATRTPPHPGSRTHVAFVPMVTATSIGVGVTLW